MLARLFVFFGGLFVLALTAALVAPHFIDWTSYRADFEREASAVLGRKVTVQGDAQARLLPFPSVTFSDVTVGGGADGKPALTVETFSMDAELAPFLSGEFLIFDMRLVRPRGALEIAADGTIDWALRPSTPFDPNRISLEKLTVTGGEVSVHHAASGRTHMVSEIDAEISAKSLAGPWRIGGTARLDGMKTALSVSTGHVDETGSMRLRIRAEPEIYPAMVETDGNIRFENGAGHYDGQFKLAQRDAAPKGEQAKAAAANPGYRVNGRFALDQKRLSIEEFLFETGPLDSPYSANGNGLLDFGEEARFALKLDGAQMRFDDAVGVDQKGALTLEQRLAALEEALASLPRPSIKGTVDVNLPAVVAGDTTIRDVRLSALPASGGWTIKSFAASLPGRTTLEAGGRLRLDGGFGFSGFLLVAVGQPSGFAAWLSKDVDEAVRRLPAAGFSAKVDLTAERQTFENLELILGKATFNGSAENAEPRDAVASTTLRLSGGALDIDGLSAFAALFVSDQGASRFAGRDLDLQVKAGPVSAGGLSAQAVDAAFRLRDSQLEIDRLSIGDFAGATISATGKATDFPHAPTGNLDVSVVAVDLAPLVDALAARYDNPLIRGLQAREMAYQGLLQDARIDIVATSAVNGDGSHGIALSAQGTAGGTALSATLSGQGDPKDPAKGTLSLSLNGRNDDATALLALYGLPALPLGVVGPGEASLSLKGSLAAGMETEAKLATAGLSAGFAGNSIVGTQGLTAKGRARIEAPDIEPLLMTIGAGMPGLGLGTPVQLDADADYADGLLVLSRLSGTVAEGAVAGDINVQVPEGKPHLTGQLTLDELDLEPLVAMVLGEAAVQSAGEDWSQVAFQASERAPFSAELGINAATLVAGPSVTAYDASADLKLDAEGLRLGDFAAKLFGGDATGLFELKNNGGTALLSAQMKLAGGDIASALGDSGLAGSSDFTAGVTASGKSVGGLVAALSGSGTATIRDLTIAGVNPGALPAFIAKADAIGKDIDVARTAEFAPDIARDGSFAAAPADLAFTVAGGVLRAPPLKLDNPAASIEANLSVDANTQRATITGSVAFKPGDEALVGSEPALRFDVSGPIGQTEQVFDSEPLAQFLTQRALEIEQARVEAMQSALLEKQRLRREVRYYAALQSERDRVAEELRRQQELERQKAEEAARAAREAEENARLEAERKQADAVQAEARKKAEAERRKADEAVRLAAEEQARRAAERVEEPAVEFAPVPPANVGAPKAKAPRPFSLDGLLKPLTGSRQ